KSRGMQDSGFATDESGNPVFEIEVNRLGPAQKSYRREAVAPIVEGPASGLLDSRMVRQAEVIIRSKHYDFTAVHNDITALLALQRHFIFKGLGLLDAVQLSIEDVVEFLGVHSYLLDVSSAARNKQQLDCLVSANQLEALLEVFERDRLSADYLFKLEAQPRFFGGKKVEHREPRIEHAAAKDAADRHALPHGVLAEIKRLQWPGRDAQQQYASTVFDQRPGIVIGSLSSAHLKNNIPSAALLGRGPLE